MVPRKVIEQSDLLAGAMVNPPPRPTEGVCPQCSTFCTGYSTCQPCGFEQNWLDAVVPISLSTVGQLHTDLRGYKDDRDPLVRRRFQVRLTAVLWRFLEAHEECVAKAAHVDMFDVVTTVPSRSAERDEAQPLRMMVSEWCGPVSQRFDRVLRRTDVPAVPHHFHPDRFSASRNLGQACVLLIEDTWTRGGSPQSAAFALKMAGAGHVGLVVVGRHLDPNFRDNAERLRGLPRRFDWGTCWRHEE